MVIGGVSFIYDLEKMEKIFKENEKNLQLQKEISEQNINKVISDRHYQIKEKNKIIGYKYSVGVIKNRFEIIEKKEKYYKF